MIKVKYLYFDTSEMVYFSSNRWTTFGLIYTYVMDNSNYNNIKKLAKDPQEEQKIKYILNELHPNKNLDVPDPYYGGEQGFEEVFQMLDNACDNIASKLKKID